MITRLAPRCLHSTVVVDSYSSILFRSKPAVDRRAVVGSTSPDLKTGELGKTAQALRKLIGVARLALVALARRVQLPQTRSKSESAVRNAPVGSGQHPNPGGWPFFVRGT
jgi:hypothetical protein